MRSVALAIGVSVIVHGVLGAALSEIDPVERPVASLPPPRVELREPPPLPAATPIDIDLVAPVPAARPDPASGPEPAPRSAPGPAPARTYIAASTGRGSIPATTGEPAPGVDPGGEPGPEGPRPPGRLSMRDLPTRPRLAHQPPRYELPPEGDPAIHPPDYQPPEPTGELRPRGGGTYTSERPGFTGKVGRDGRVSFRDKPDFSVKLTLPRPWKAREYARDAARDLEGWFDDPYRDVKKAVKNPSRLCAVAEDACPEPPEPGKHVYDDDKPDHGGVIPVLGGAFNPSDWIMKKAGIDPYQAEKLAWMDRTRDERAELGRVHRERALARTNATVQQHLAALWARAELDPAARREALFELWDECVEDGEPAAVEAGARARKAIVGFIRARLPAGSADAYTSAELAALNRRRTSRAAFAPYAD